MFRSCVEWGSTNTGWYINVHHVKNLYNLIIMMRLWIGIMFDCHLFVSFYFHLSVYCIHVSENYEAIAHQAQVKFSHKPLSNPDTDLNPIQEAHEYH